MKYSLLTVALLPLAYAGCYTGGEAWPDNKPAITKAIAKTSEFFVRQGPLSPGEHELTQKVDGVCVQFILDNLQEKPAKVTEQYAVNHFSNEYTGCEYGGDSSYDNWRFVADPNAC
ncbi:uncharacterized protein F4822DRAFT_428992 [Hypoxylon trugodes]|uniref:uncharacterized protein n=1 Tax=Hypoxylon trugodes TaxID=326681 RepID=UPI0021949121|nr:uncharacterized protein F4822DRAFT_428992 [Hypoxylon trugodes]KAI1388366.1 hypothetical protein F4822DRAFT_428992 [Hypoxylon trugodes]